MTRAIVVTCTGGDTNATTDGEVFLSFELGKDDLTISIWPNRDRSRLQRSKLWSHSVFEFQNFAAGLRLIATNRVATLVKLPAADILIGPHVSIWPALTFEIGHPGFDTKERGTTFFCRKVWRPMGDSDLVRLDAIQGDFGASVKVSVEQVMRLSDFLEAQAKRLAPQFVS